MHPYRIVLADDHIEFREAIKQVIETSTDINVVGEVGNSCELLEVIRKKISHMVVLDMSMPNLGGIEATREIKKAFPAVKVLILSMHKMKEYVDHTLYAGADGYLLKDETGENLCCAIETIRKGGIYIAPQN